MMNNFKKTAIAAALVTTVAAGVSAPRPAQAVMLLAGESNILHSVGDTILCLALLPFCILDKDLKGTLVSKQALLDNGYSEAQVSEIQMGQNLFVQAIEQGHFRVPQKVLSQPYLLSVEIEKQIPGIPQGYLEFVRNN